MKLLIVCSEPADPRCQPGPFERQFDSAWADRFIRHLRNDRDLCTGCGDRCVHCRDWRVHDVSPDIVDIVRLPSLLPELLDDAVQYLPTELPYHDVLVAIHIHEELLLDLPALSAAAGGRALIAPVEAPGWVSRWTCNQLIKKCRTLGMEAAVPKPFCDLAVGTGPVIDEFIQTFALGRPEIAIEVIDGKIAHAEAIVSAPCGNSHYVAHNLQGHPVDDDLAQAVSHYWHAFPCTASMQQDAELGDTILHRGGQIHMTCFCRATGLLR